MKLIDFYSLYYLLSSYLDSPLPARASFAIAKFIVSNESSYKLYLSKRAELISKYADKDEKGELIVDGNGYKVTPENMVLLQKELSDLNDYEIEPVQLTLYFEDLSSLSLTPRAYSLLIPYISE